MNILQIGLGAAVLAAALGAGGLWAFQTWGVYRFDQTRHTPAGMGLADTRVASFRSEDGAEIHAWIRPPAPGRPVILAFHGNGGGTGESLRRLMPLAEAGYGLVMMEYRGSGATAGPPGEARFAADARALYDALDGLMGEEIPAARRVLHGFSLGTGVGGRLAAERPFAAVILEASFPSACLYYQKRFRGLPMCLLMWSERYDVIDRIGAVAAPKLFVHGGRDAAVPPDWGRALHDAAPGPKTFVLLEDGGHADLAAHGLIPAMRDFLAANGL
jgi:uncharacterized protein